jgi:hypothetical protein
MKEIYNLTEFTLPNFFSSYRTILYPVFLFFVIIAIVKLINVIKTHNTKELFAIICVFLVCTIFFSYDIYNYNKSINTYNECISIENSESYKIATGEIKDFEYELEKYSDTNYYISFSVENIDFDSESYVYANDVFTIDDIKSLENSKYVEVKYATFKNDNVIISISVYD